MDKSREAFENSLGHTDGFHDGYVTHNPITGMYESNDDDYECVADWLNGAWKVWQSRQAEVDEANAKSQMCRDEKTHAINRWSQIRKEVEEKDKRIESALYALKGLKAENDLWGCDQVEVQIEILEKALRGEHG